MRQNFNASSAHLQRLMSGEVGVARAVQEADAKRASSAAYSGAAGVASAMMRRRGMARTASGGDVDASISGVDGADGCSEFLTATGGLALPRRGSVLQREALSLGVGETLGGVAEGVAAAVARDALAAAAVAAKPAKRGGRPTTFGKTSVALGEASMRKHQAVRREVKSLAGRYVQGELTHAAHDDGIALDEPHCGPRMAGCSSTVLSRLERDAQTDVERMSRPAACGAHPLRAPPPDEQAASAIFRSGSAPSARPPGSHMIFSGAAGRASSGVTDAKEIRRRVDDPHASLTGAAVEYAERCESAREGSDAAGVASVSLVRAGTQEACFRRTPATTPSLMCADSAGDRAALPGHAPAGHGGAEAGARCATAFTDAAGCCAWRTMYSTEMAERV